MEGGTSSEMRASVEEVPELKHHENRENVALLRARKSFCCSKRESAKVGKRSDICVLKHIDQTNEDEEEQRTSADDASFHSGINDEGFAMAWTIFHHSFRRRKRSQSHSGKGVHDEIHPQHLRHSEWRICAHESTSKHHAASSHIDRHLEEDETLDVLIERTSPHHGSTDGRERVVYDGDVTGFFGYRCAIAHRKSHVSCFESRGIISAVARYRHDVSALLERFDQTFLIERTCTSYDFQFIDTIVHFFIGEGFKLWTSDDGTL